MAKRAEQSNAALEQAVLPFGVPPVRYAAADYLISQSNDEAWRMATGWLGGEAFGLVISGPAGAGKTHLALVLESHAPGTRVQIVDDALSAAPDVLLDRLCDIELAGQRVILTGRGDPQDWSEGLADLRTRLNAMARVCLPDPDETLIVGVLNKMFADRQWSIDPEISAFVAPRIPRTFAAAKIFVETCDQEMMRKGSKLTKQNAKTIAAKLFDQDQSVSTTPEISQANCEGLGHDTRR